MEHLQVPRDVAQIKKQQTIKYSQSLLSYPRITQERENVNFKDKMFFFKFAKNSQIS